MAALSSLIRARHGNRVAALLVEVSFLVTSTLDRATEVGSLFSMAGNERRSRSALLPWFE
jgi:hypothetical protein